MWSSSDIASLCQAHLSHALCGPLAGLDKCTICGSRWAPYLEAYAWMPLIEFLDCGSSSLQWPQYASCRANGQCGSLIRDLSFGPLAHAKVGCTCAAEVTGCCWVRLDGDGVPCREIINHLKRASPTHFNATAMSPPVAQQILSSMLVLMGRDGSTRGRAKLDRLRDNANYFRGQLLSAGCNVLGDWDSPVMVPPHAWHHHHHQLHVAPALPLLVPAAAVCWAPACMGNMRLLGLPGMRALPASPLHWVLHPLLPLLKARERPFAGMAPHACKPLAVRSSCVNISCWILSPEPVVMVDPVDTSRS